jgi:glycosyltransferase involved in cell wall biosynthesis
MHKCSVSVIIPTYNSGRLVTEAVDSVLAQTAVPAEIIVVDDGSRDDTRARLAPYGDRIRYVYQENQGVSAARNNGVRHATCELVAFLDADDAWHPRKIEFQTAILARRPELGVLGTAIFDWPARQLPAAWPPAPDQIVDIPWRKLVVRNYLTTSTILMRRGVLDRIGEFDTRLQGPEDYDLWLRATAVTRLANLRTPLTGYRMVQGSLSKQAATMHAGMRRILRKVDERRGWGGSWLLRRKAYSYIDYSCSIMYGAAGCHAAALGTVLKSLVWYPLPFRRSEVRNRLARPKTLLMALWRLLRGAKGSPRPQDGPAKDVAQGAAGC